MQTRFFLNREIVLVVLGRALVRPRPFLVRRFSTRLLTNRPLNER